MIKILEKGASFSPDRVYRYSLWRFWKQPANNYAVFVGLNPSTADEDEDDPTVRRCINYVFDWGYDALIMLNAFAYRSTDPKRLSEIKDPIGPMNDFYLNVLSKDAGITVTAWGNIGNYRNRSHDVLKLLKEPYHLGWTKSGMPRHPLYLKKTVIPEPWPWGVISK